MIVRYWHSDRPPVRIADALATFPTHNPDLTQLVFDEARAEVFIGEHFSSREVNAFRACGVPTMQADYFRYCAVLVLGGAYADADLGCIASIKPLVEQCDGGILFGQSGSVRNRPNTYRWPYDVSPYLAIGNGFFVFRRPGHVLLKAAVEIATINIERRVANGPPGIWLTAGPGVLTSIYLLHQLRSIDVFMQYVEGTVLEPSAPLFCEIVEDISTVDELLEDIAIRPRRESYGWFAPVEAATPYSGEAVNWRTVKGSIFK